VVLTPTLFEACRAEGRASAAIVGDQHLIGACGAHTADVHWPPGTATQLAVVGGGHPRARELAARIEDVRPPAAWWAADVAAPLDLAWRPGRPLPARPEVVGR
jgi:hypothetical protein